MTILLSLLISILNIIATHALLTRKRSIKYCIVAYLFNTLGFLHRRGIYKKVYH